MKNAVIGGDRLKGAKLSKATLGRLPTYLKYIEAEKIRTTVSSAELSQALKFGEIQVRKDLNSISKSGRPKVGFDIKVLREDIEKVLGKGEPLSAVVIGAGKLGTALLGYKGFEEYGIRIIAAFDSNKSICCGSIYPMEELERFCRQSDIRIGIITVPSDHAQKVCDHCIHCGINVIWNFAACDLRVPEGITVSYENLALSLAHLALHLRQPNFSTEE